MDVVITNHAFQQYCIRVEEIDRADLHVLLVKQLAQIERCKGDFIKLGGVWWVYVNQTFITCYGRSHLDMPRAIKWAARMNDRIRL